MGRRSVLAIPAGTVSNEEKADRRKRPTERIHRSDKRRLDAFGKAGDRQVEFQRAAAGQNAQNAERRSAILGFLWSWSFGAPQRQPRSVLYDKIDEMLREKRNVFMVAATIRKSTGALKNTLYDKLSS